MRRRSKIIFKRNLCVVKSEIELIKRRQCRRYLLLSLLVIAVIRLANSEANRKFSAKDHFSAIVARTKRWANEPTLPQSNNNRQQQSIPAANANFEAAFQGECGKNNNSNPCQHICLDLHDGTYECSCFYGFTLAVDGYSCASIEPILSSAKSLVVEPSESRQQSGEYEKSRQQIEVDIEQKSNGNVQTTDRDKFMAKGAPFILQRANDNRKLVEEANGSAKLSNNEIGVQDEGAIGIAPMKIENEKKRRLLSKVPLWKQLPALYSVQSNRSNRAANIVVSEAKPQTTAKSIASLSIHMDQIQSDEVSARDKWLSYDVFTNRKSGNPIGRSDLTSADFIELSDEGYEDLDPEIESIMMSNDKLVKRLADSVDISASTNKFGSADIMRSNEEELDYDLNLLEQLVRKTIEDYALQKEDSDAKQKIDTISTTTITTIKKTNEPLVNRSTLRPKRKAQLANVNKGIKLPSSGESVQRMCGSDAMMYTNCLDLPECESGGQCVVERISNEMQLEATRARCRCPIGRGGYLCQKPIQRSVPRFTGHSYLALPMISSSSITNLRLLFKAEPNSNSERQANLLLYSQRFVLLLVDMSRVELRYLTKVSEDESRITRVIGSRDVQADRWNELIVTDASIETNQSAKDRIVLVAPDKILLDRNQNSTEFFVAGLPDGLKMRTESSDQQFFADERMTSGFVGCIKELNINGRQYNFKSDLNGDTLDGFDVGECCN